MPRKNKVPKFTWNVETMYGETPGVWIPGRTCHRSRQEAREELAQWTGALVGGMCMRVVKYQRSTKG